MSYGTISKQYGVNILRVVSCGVLSERYGIDRVYIMPRGFHCRYDRTIGVLSMPIRLYGVCEIIDLRGLFGRILPSIGGSVSMHSVS